MNKFYLSGLLALVAMFSFVTSAVAKEIGETDRFAPALGHWVTLPPELHYEPIFVPIGCSIGGYIDEFGQVQIIGTCE